MEQDLKHQSSMEKNKIPFYLKLREATIRDIELTPDERKLVNIRDHFDKIRKNENVLNSWLVNLKHKVTKKKPSVIREEHNRVVGLDDSPKSPRKGNMMRRRLSLRKRSSSKINKNLSFIVHQNKLCSDRKFGSMNFNKLSFQSNRERSARSSFRKINESCSPSKSSKSPRKRFNLDQSKFAKNSFLLDPQQKFKYNKFSKSVERNGKHRFIQDCISKLKFIGANYLITAATSHTQSKLSKEKSKTVNFLIKELENGDFDSLNCMPKFKLLEDDHVFMSILDELNSYVKSGHTQFHQKKSSLVTPSNRRLFDVDDYKDNDHYMPAVYPTNTKDRSNLVQSSTTYSSFTDQMKYFKL